MPEDCSFGAAITLKDCLYVVGRYHRTFEIRPGLRQLDMSESSGVAPRPGPAVAGGEDIITIIIIVNFTLSGQSKRSKWVHKTRKVYLLK